MTTIKISKIVLACISFFVCASCVTLGESGHISDSPSALYPHDSDSPSIPIINSPAPSYVNMPQQFDPFSPPDEWFDSEWVNEEKCIKIEEDYQLDKFRIDMAYSTAATFFPSDSYSFEVIDDGYYTTKTMIFDSIELMFIKLTEEAEEEYELFTITLIDDSYITSRGLRVGDPVEKLYELYGTPRYVSDSVWSFCDSGGFYIRFSATVIDGVVRKASINQVL